MWEKLARALEKESWLSDARFADSIARVRHRDDLTREIESVLATGDVDHWVELLNRTGVPAGPVFDLAQVFKDPAAPPTAEV